MAAHVFRFPLQSLRFGHHTRAALLAAQLEDGVSGIKEEEFTAILSDQVPSNTPLVLGELQKLSKNQQKDFF